MLVFYFILGEGANGGRKIPVQSRSLIRHPVSFNIPERRYVLANGIDMWFFVDGTGLKALWMHETAHAIDWQMGERNHRWSGKSGSGFVLWC